MKRVLAVGAMGIMLTVTGCATSFTGSAKVDGPDDCRKICGNWKMDLAGMVAMGEYTNGCICKTRGEQLSLNGIAGSVLLGSAGAVGGSAGVYMQNQED